MTEAVHSLMAGRHVHPPYSWYQEADPTTADADKVAAGQHWLKISTQVEYRRNDANSAWVVVQSPAVGPTGPAGGAGEAGATGPTGPQGVAGASGAAGSAGATGPTGAASTVAGPTGPAGGAGSAGPTGPTGAASTAVGPTGPAGSSGSNAGELSSVNFVIDGGGAAITTGVKGDVRIHGGYTITGVTLLADQSGSIVVDIWKDTYASFPPTVGDTIAASAKPTLSAATKAEDTTLTGWTTGLTDGDVLRFNVDSASTVTRVTVALKLARA